MIRSSGAFSLIELVITVVILSVIASIAVPRLSRGADGAAEAALKADLATVRQAIDRYAAEHRSKYPDNSRVVEQLTQYTNASGVVSATKTPTHIYGPYLRKIPPVPLGPNRGSNTVVTTSGGVKAGDLPAGWIYDDNDGRFRVNTNDTVRDTAAKAYNSY